MQSLIMKSRRATFIEKRQCRRESSVDSHGTVVLHRQNGSYETILEYPTTRILMPLSVTFKLGV